MTTENATVEVDGQNIEKVNAFIYLGHALRTGRDNQTAELKRRIRIII